MFEVGREYKRTAIHEKYKGSRQRGITRSSSHSIVLIFTSNTGQAFGYIDEFRDGVFMYTGEGQVGDMEMNRGNAAIRDHARENNTLHIFESTKKAYVRYVGSAEYLGHHEEARPDRDKNDRKAIVFHLGINSTDLDDKVSFPRPLYGPKNVKDLEKKDLNTLREAALSTSPKDSAPEEKRQVIYYRSVAIKLYAIKRSNGICEGCGEKAPFKTKKGPYLECHHINRLSDGGPDHPKNVIALCPNCHRRAHYATDAGDYNDQLKSKAIEIEENI